MRLQVLSSVATLAATSVCQTLWSRDVDYKALSKELSASAKVYFPGSDDFETASTRWSNLDVPTVNIVVVPGTENDVVETVSCVLHVYLFAYRFTSNYHIASTVVLQSSLHNATWMRHPPSAARYADIS